MNITNSDNSSQKIHGFSLSVEQLNAIDVLITGATDKETASATRVTRETVTRWKNDNPNFIAELNKRRRLLWCSGHEKLRSLLTKAVDVLENELDSGNFRAAVEVLRAVGIYGQIEHQFGAEDAELIMWEEAKKWAELEIDKKGPSSDPNSLGVVLNQVQP